MDLECVVVELQRDHLIGKLDAFCCEIDAFHHAAKNRVRILGVATLVR